MGAIIELVPVTISGGPGSGQTLSLLKRVSADAKDGERMSEYRIETDERVLWSN